MSPCTLLYQVWSLESLMAILCQPVLTLASNAVSEERPVNIDIAMRYNGGAILNIATLQTGAHNGSWRYN